MLKNRERSELNNPPSVRSFFGIIFKASPYLLYSGIVKFARPKLLRDSREGLPSSPLALIHGQERRAWEEDDQRLFPSFLRRAVGFPSRHRPSSAFPLATLRSISGSSIITGMRSQGFPFSFLSHLVELLSHVG